ncbi:MAG: UDP-glucose 4-epimerase [Verrucomicrobia bacterium]|nr:UDP-glucose 4-epimerase [Verrucomicrobiota bacterium]
MAAKWKPANLGPLTLSRAWSELKERERMNSKTVFLTGATGVIGSRLAPLFLKEPGTRLCLLIRAKSDSHLHERLGELSDFWQLDCAEHLRSGRLRVLKGDSWLPRMGLSDEVFTRLAGEVTHIVDAAGNVKFNQPMDEALAHTMCGIENAVELARLAQKNGQFVKLDWVSTVGVTGRLPGLLREEAVTVSREFHNTYEASKARAEEFLLAQMSAGLPATIHRPSMVVGDSLTGRIIHYQVFYHVCEFLSGLRTLGFVAESSGHKLDIVPVDYVSHAIHLASGRPDTIGRIFNLCSGPELAVSLASLTGEIRRMMAAKGVRLPRLHEIPPKWIARVAPALSCLLPARPRRMIASLPLFLTYIGESQGFDNSGSLAFFKREGLSLPLPQDYLSTVLECYLGGKKKVEAARKLKAPKMMRGRLSGNSYGFSGSGRNQNRTEHAVWVSGVNHTGRPATMGRSGNADDRVR